MTRVSAFALWMLAACPAAAHVMSMSSGDLTVEGARAHYELRMPLYELTHVQNPERVLLEHVRFAGARMLGSECHTDTARDAFLCSADYEFRAPVEQVGRGVHVRRDHGAQSRPPAARRMGGKRDEAIFDIGFHQRDAALPSAHGAPKPP